MSEQPPKSIRVRVLDREYPLRVAPADVGYTQHLAQLVDARLRRLREVIPNQPDLTHAVIGALEMAEELYAARAEIDRLRAQVEVEAKALAARLDAALAPEAGDGAAAPDAPPAAFAAGEEGEKADDDEG
ncbi:MAG TPA: cell division protein ZapA [Rubricoccaceae bacterium]|nr:cell division protein ZapA [Rubricoccaceae bacterium]